jgi:hypothetical protein
MDIVLAPVNDLKKSGGNFEEKNIGDGKPI